MSSGQYRTARRWARAIWAHPARPDGMLYRLRHDDERYCCGLFDRTADALRENSLGSLPEKHAELLGKILEHYGFGLI
ncbi:RES domain-containing protein [Gloeobacter violaceus]|nr:RES domain-containing protein [Gloeobacter violaceus]